MLHPALPGDWGTTLPIGLGSVCAAPAVLTTNPQQQLPCSAHRWEVATWLCLPFIPHESVLLARCQPLTWIQTIVRASINSVLITAFIPRAGKLLWSTIISATCYLPPQLTEERTVSNCCVTYTITATLQLQPYHSYRGLAVALSPTRAMAAGLLLAAEEKHKLVSKKQTPKQWSSPLWRSTDWMLQTQPVSAITYLQKKSGEQQLICAITLVKLHWVNFCFF